MEERERERERESPWYMQFFFRTLHLSMSGKTAEFQGGLQISRIPHRHLLYM
jgi:hypothetical protein